MVLAYKITPNARTLSIHITDLHEVHLHKIFEMMNTRSNMQLSDLNSKPYGGKSLRDLVEYSIGVRFYPPPGSEHYKLLCLENFHFPTNINVNHRKKDETKTTRIV